jgi:hypothetical protein
MQAGADVIAIQLANNETLIYTPTRNVGCTTQVS